MPDIKEIKLKEENSFNQDDEDVKNLTKCFNTALNIAHNFSKRLENDKYEDDDFSFDMVDVFYKILNILLKKKNLK